jgi:hypothetical protein
MKNVTRFLSAAALASLLASLPLFTTLGTAQAGTPTTTSVRGAPGPIAGAGLPVLAIGYGVYWLVKRRRKAD